MLPALCRNYFKSSISFPNYVNGLDSSPSSALRHSTDAVHFAGDTSPTKMEEIERVLKKGANVNTKKNGKTILYKAAQDGNLEQVKLLLKYKADVNIPDNQGNTPLMALAKRTIVGQDSGKIFLELDDQLSSEDWEVLKHTLEWDREDSEAQALMGIRSKYYDPRKGDFYKNNFEIAKLLITHDTNLSAMNDEGETAGMLAIKHTAHSNYNNFGVADAIKQARETQQVQNAQTNSIIRHIVKKLPILTTWSPLN